MHFLGGLTYGRNAFFALYSNWPFVRVDIYANDLLITSLIKNIDLKKEEIVRISTYRWLFWRGIRIEHSSTQYKPSMVFWTGFKFEKVKSALIQSGYVVSK